MVRLPGLLLLNESPDSAIVQGSGSTFTRANVEQCVESVLNKTDAEIASKRVKLTSVELNDRKSLRKQGHINATPANAQPSNISDSAAARLTGSTFGDMLLEPHLVVTKLALLSAVMRHCDMKKVRFQPAVGSCPGLLLHPQFFK